MKRLFAGISFQIEICPDLKTILKKMKISADKKNLSIKWVPAANYHVTLFFYGDTAEEQIFEIKEKLSSIAKTHETMKLELKGIGGFPDDRSTRVIWAGVQNSRPLRALQSDIQEQMEASGLRQEFRSFQPHLTLARLRNPRSCTDLFSPFTRKSFGKFTADRIVLYESVLEGSFPKHISLGEFPLTGATAPQDEDI